MPPNPTSPDSEDEVLEMMLIEAQRLALRMRSTTSDGYTHNNNTTSTTTVTTTFRNKSHSLKTSCSHYSDRHRENSATGTTTSDRLINDEINLIARSRSSSSSIGSLNDDDVEQDPIASSRMSLSSFLEEISSRNSSSSYLQPFPHEQQRKSSSGDDEKSFSSAATSAQHNAIAEAIKATHEMEQSLRQALSSSSISESLRIQLDESHDNPVYARRIATPSISSSSSPVSLIQRPPAPPSPSQEIGTQSAKTKINYDARQLHTSTASHVNWGLQVKTDDADFVPIVDYTSPNRKSSNARENNSEIKWVKITSPEKDDEDYVPVADYTKCLPQSPIQSSASSSCLSRDGSLSTQRRTNHHKRAMFFSSLSSSSSSPRDVSTRRRRRRQRRIVARAIILLTITTIGMYNWYHRPNTIIRPLSSLSTHDDAIHISVADSLPLLVTVSEGPPHEPGYAVLMELNSVEDPVNFFRPSKDSESKTELTECEVTLLDSVNDASTTFSLPNYIGDEPVACEIVQAATVPSSDNIPGSTDAVHVDDIISGENGMDIIDIQKAKTDASVNAKSPTTTITLPWQLFTRANLELLVDSMMQ